MKEASAYSRPDADPERRLRVLVTRHWPRAVSWRDIDVWVRSLAPSAALLSEYKHDQISWDEFSERYVAEQQEVTQIIERRPGKDERVLAMTPLEYLAMIDIMWPEATLMCVEKAGEHCHRHLLLDLYRSFQDDQEDTALETVFRQGA